jgi:hypothetical protein
MKTLGQFSFLLLTTVCCTLVMAQPAMNFDFKTPYGKKRCTFLYWKVHRYFICLAPAV